MATFKVKVAFKFHYTHILSPIFLVQHSITVKKKISNGYLISYKKTIALDLLFRRIEASIKAD